MEIKGNSQRDKTEPFPRLKEFLAPVSPSFMGNILTKGGKDKKTGKRVNISLMQRH